MCSEEGERTEYAGQQAGSVDTDKSDLPRSSPLTDLVCPRMAGSLDGSLWNMSNPDYS